MIPPLKRSEIVKILKRNRGSIAELSRRASVKMQTVSGWMRRMTISENISDKAETLARELLVKEEQERVAKGLANGPSARAIAEQIRAAKKNPTEE